MKIVRFLSAFWGIALLLAAWQAWVSVNGLNSIVMPSPGAVAAAVFADPAPLLAGGLQTLGLAVAGLIVGLAAGTGFAVLCWASRLLDGMLTPLSVVFASVPVVALIPVIARLLGYDIRTEIAIVAIICFLPGFVFTGAGMRALPPGSADLMRVLGAGRWTTLWRLALPAAVPSWMVAFRLAAPQSVLAAMVAEFLMGTEGLGSAFRTARDQFDMDRALALSAVATVASITVFLSALAAERRARERMT
jgi:ABC-type nitrate/sulfonate/bicarbonate transport system permease component